MWEQAELTRHMIDRLNFDHVWTKRPKTRLGRSDLVDAAIRRLSGYFYSPFFYVCFFNFFFSSFCFFFTFFFFPLSSSSSSSFSLFRFPRPISQCYYSGQLFLLILGSWLCFLILDSWLCELGLLISHENLINLGSSSDCSLLSLDTLSLSWYVLSLNKRILSYEKPSVFEFVNTLVNKFYIKLDLKKKVKNHGNYQDLVSVSRRYLPAVLLLLRLLRSCRFGTVGMISGN